MRRLCIYLTYDKQKIVDAYIGYMLKELKTCVDYLVVVCNEKEVVYGADTLEAYADEIFYRENIGFDAGGFKDVLCHLLGWDRVLLYDELVLVNDSMFGPFKPMQEIFTEMDNKQLDFWGLSKHGERRNSKNRCFSEYIQSYFLCIRKKMLHSGAFRKYWEDMPYYKDFWDVVYQHEEIFTSYFAGMGYTYDVLADIEANDSKKNKANNYMQYGFISYELMRKRNFPFLKKQQIAYNMLEEQTQENLKQALDYIDRETGYDVNLIWKNIIRTLNITDLQRSLHLQYIITSEHTETPGELQRLNPQEVSGKPIKRMIAVFISYKDSAEYILEYLQKLKGDYIVKVFAEKAEYLEIYQKQGFECKEVRFNKIIDLLAGFCEYSFVCVVHDADVTSDRKPSYTGKSYLYNIWENLLKNKKHVQEILRHFSNEPFLGFLAPPSPGFGEYFGEYRIGWNGKFDTIQRIVGELDLNCQLSEYNPPFRITENFWIRGAALKKLKNINNEDIPYLSYLWSYFAQDAGYYSGIVESTDYASMNEVNLIYYLRQITCQIGRQCGDFSTFSEMSDKMRLSMLDGFCRKYSKLLIYGAGEIAQKYKKLLPEIEAYVVSDGKKKEREIEGIQVKYLSEIEQPEKYGIVLCMNERHQKQVIPLLQSRGIKHYFCV